MSYNKPKWNVIPIKGFEDGDLNKFSLEYLTRSEAHKGRFVSEETRKLFSKIHKGKIITEDQKQKQSEKLKGRKFTIDHKQKIGSKHKGKIVSKDTRQKLSEINKGKKLSKETIEKMSKSMLGVNKGKKRSDETKKIFSEIAKNRKYTEETRKKMSESSKKRINHFNEEAIKNRRAKTLKPILCYSYPDMKFICEYESITEASIKLNRDKGGIGKILNGTIKEPRKLTFKYKN